LLSSRGKDAEVIDYSALCLRFLSGVLLNFRILQLAGVRLLLCELAVERGIFSVIAILGFCSSLNKSFNN
jgi:hypothetical protein